MTLRVCVCIYTTGFRTKKKRCYKKDTASVGGGFTLHMCFKVNNHTYVQINNHTYMQYTLAYLMLKLPVLPFLTDQYVHH